MYNDVPRGGNFSPQEMQVKQTSANTALKYARKAEPNTKFVSDACFSRPIIFLAKIAIISDFADTAIIQNGSSWVTAMQSIDNSLAEVALHPVSIKICRKMHHI